MHILLHLRDNSDNIMYERCILEQCIVSDRKSNSFGPIQIKIQTRRIEKDMNKTDIFEAAKYMVALHYKADKQYTCNRTKIEKMLAIADLISIIGEDTRLFPALLIFINSCGMGYNVLSKDIVRFPMDNIIAGNEKILTEHASPKPVIVLDHKRNVPDLYLTNALSDHTKEILENVFLEFSPYSAKFIGSQMDEFKEYIKSSIPSAHNSKYFIDMEQTKKFFASGDSILESNFVAKYILEYHN